MTTYTTDPTAYIEFVHSLKAKNSDEVLAMIKHIRNDEYFHPDDEFYEMHLNGEITDDEALDALFMRFDELTRQVAS